MIVIVAALSPWDVSLLAAPEETTSRHSHPFRLDSTGWTFITNLYDCAQDTIKEPYEASFKSTPSVNMEEHHTPRKTTQSRLQADTLRHQHPPSWRKDATHGQLCPQVCKESRHKRFLTYINPAIYLEDKNKPYLTLWSVDSSLWVEKRKHYHHSLMILVLDAASLMLSTEYPYC